eukprot:TRINITY_DN3282_c0_g2_i1.p1 TRINITY_DN3282_c0_g2~~TRINITY_DN3282_c0_g2_i1.p1  ORF type:complete len:134 (+),score=39.21 TRINITY_DN3282_c0_g2_i1:3-404(+)
MTQYVKRLPNLKPIQSASNTIGLTSSKSLEESNARACRLYRDAVRSTSFIKDIYELDEDEDVIKGIIRKEFGRHSHVTNPQVADMIIWKGQQELHETLSVFKQKTHVLRYFEEQVVVDKKEASTFLEQFYQGN